MTNTSVGFNYKNTFVLLDTNSDEVISITRSLPSKTSCGIDGISTIILKHSIDAIAQPLATIINKTFHCGSIPSALKLSQVIPIYKSGNKDELLNYRPISLLPVISKVIEKVVYTRLLSFINKNNIISNSQFGFRSNTSTSHAIIHLVNLITSYLDKSEKVAGVFLDLSKAFDSLDHTILLQKLHAYGFRGPIYSWLKSFITNRFQCVLHNGIQSNFLKISRGIAQGSILGPLLFILYINDLHLVSNKCKFVLFADDTTILFNGKNVAHLERTISNELAIISKWFITNRLALNLKKTCIIPLYVRKPLLFYSIYINDTIIPCLSNTRFLGVFIDSQLNWSYHINFVCNKIAQCICMLRVCVCSLPFYVRLQMYYAFAQSYLVYGIECWGNASKELLNRILVLQKRVIRYIYCLSPLTHCAPYAAYANILFINELHVYQLCILAYKVYHSLPIPEIIACLFKKPNYVYDTRNVDLNFSVYSSKLNIRRFSPIIDSAFKWNSLAREIRTNKPLHVFKQKLKLDLLTKYI